MSPRPPRLRIVTLDGRQEFVDQIAPEAPGAQPARSYFHVPPCGRLRRTLNLMMRTRTAVIKIPAVMITALVSNDDAPGDAVVQSGADVMLAKPIRTEKLVAAIEQRLAGVI